MSNHAKHCDHKDTIELQFQSLFLGWCPACGSFYVPDGDLSNRIIKALIKQGYHSRSHVTYAPRGTNRKIRGYFLLPKGESTTEGGIILPSIIDMKKGLS